MFEVTVMENEKYGEETFEFDTFEEVGEFYYTVVFAEGHLTAALEPHHN